MGAEYDYFQSLKQIEYKFHDWFSFPQKTSCGDPKEVDPNGDQFWKVSTKKCLQQDLLKFIDKVI